MKIYISAPYPTRDDAIKVMHHLESLGHEVTSRWLKAPDELSDAYAREDLADVARADLLLALNGPEWANAGTGGRHVELGYALCMGKQVVLVGARTNIFHYLDCIRVIERLEGL